jgi:phosphopantetheinyl transferase
VPELQLLDARAAGLDAAGLRLMARDLTDGAGAAYAARSYRFPWALVAWHDRPVGVDLERIGPVERSFAESIATPAERAELAAITDLDRWATDLWCSKEALTKALGDAVAYDPRRLEAPTRWPGLSSGPWRASRVMALPAGHVGWLCWR